MIEIVSFGYLHDGPPRNANLILDARDLIRDPHVDPALRQMTGRNKAVQDAVMGTPGAQALVDVLTRAVVLANEVGNEVCVAIGCQGGRHRSVVLADRLADALFVLNFSVEVWHRDVKRPVVQR